MGVVSICLPTLRPILSLIMPRQFGTVDSVRARKPHGTEETDTWPQENPFERLQDCTGTTGKRDAEVSRDPPFDLTRMKKVSDDTSHVRGSECSLADIELDALRNEIAMAR